MTEIEARKEAVSIDRKSTRLNSSHSQTSYAVFCLKKKKQIDQIDHALKLHRPAAKNLLGGVAGVGIRLLGQRQSASVATVFFFKKCGANRDLHSFPTRRSSD